MTINLCRGFAFAWCDLWLHKNNKEFNRDRFVSFFSLQHFWERNIFRGCGRKERKKNLSPGRFHFDPIKRYKTLQIQFLFLYDKKPVNSEMFMKYWSNLVTIKKTSERGRFRGKGKTAIVQSQKSPRQILTFIIYFSCDAFSFHLPVWAFLLGFAAFLIPLVIKNWHSFLNYLC